MVNILIHQFQPDGGVVDKAALEQFQKQWATYQKVVDADGLSHKAVGKILHALRSISNSLRSRGHNARR